MNEVLSMAGNYTAHAVWSVSNGETLIPILGHLDAANSRTMTRLVMGPVSAIAKGDEALNNVSQKDKGVVFIKDAMIEIAGVKTDCLLVDVRFGSHREKKIQYAQPYRHAANDNGFAVNRLKITDYTGFSEDEVRELTQSFYDGIDTHAQGATFWDSNYSAEIEDSKTYHEQGSGYQQIDGDHFDKLCRSPFLVFCMTAAADGKVDKKELVAFIKVLLAADQIDDPLFRRVLSNIIDKVEPMLTEMVSSPIDFAKELAETKAILENNFPANEADKFKASLLATGYKIAEASGGLFSKISKNEKKALAAIALCLGINQ